LNITPEFGDTLEFEEIPEFAENGKLKENENLEVLGKMKRSEAREEVVRSLMSDLSHQELVSDLLSVAVIAWSDDELIDFLFGDDSDSTIEND